MTNKKFKTKWNLIRANGSKHELLELNKLEQNEIKLQTKENKGKKVKIRLKEIDICVFATILGYVYYYIWLSALLK